MIYVVVFAGIVLAFVFAVYSFNSEEQTVEKIFFESFS